MRRYRLHYAPDNASLVVRLALEELGQPYDTVLVDRAARGHKAPEYRALNPAGLIPVLETPDGPVFETGAILLWLADRHGALAPAPDSPDRGAFLKWLFFTSNTLHAGLRMRFYPAQYAAGDPAAQAVLSAHMKGEAALARRHDGLGARPLPGVPAPLGAALPGGGGHWLGRPRQLAASAGDGGAAGIPPGHRRRDPRRGAGPSPLHRPAPRRPARGPRHVTPHRPANRCTIRAHGAVPGPPIQAGAGCCG
jgi:glutathione S-transferase